MKIICYDTSNRSGLPPKCWALLPRARRRRKPQRRCEQAKRSVLGDCWRICDYVTVRCEVDNRQEVGHLEGDLIIGKHHQTTIATLVKRKSRQTLVVGLGDGYDAVNTAKAVTQALARQPAHMVKTSTSKNHTSNHRRPSQQHAQKTPPLEHSPNHIQSTMSRPPIELA